MSATGSAAQSSRPNASFFHQHLLNTLSGNSDTQSPETRSVTSDPELLRSPPSISIGHVFVYNFPPPCQRENANWNFPPTSQTESTIEISGVYPKDPNRRSSAKVISPGTNSGPFCRICHEGDGREDLLSPCYCTGTVGLMHISCVERWLSMSGSDRCEICHYVFSTVRNPRTFAEWVKSPSANSGPRNLNTDVMCFCLLTPLAAVSCFLSLEGARRQVQLGNSIEAGCLMALATFLLTVYIIWNVMTIRYHFRNFRRWRSKNQSVKVLRVRRSSSTRHLDTTVPGQCVNHRFSTPETQITTDQSTSDTSETRVTLPVDINDEVFVHPHCDLNGSDLLQHLAVMLETTV